MVAPELVTQGLLANQWAAAVAFAGKAGGKPQVAQGQIPGVSNHCELMYIANNYAKKALQL